MSGTLDKVELFADELLETVREARDDMPKATKTHTADGKLKDPTRFGDWEPETVKITKAQPPMTREQIAEADRLAQE